MVESGKVTTVQVEDNQIVFLTKENEGLYYITGKLEDPTLVDRLHNANVKFERVIPKENSALVDAILSWVLPLMIFIGLGQILSKQLQKRWDQVQCSLVKAMLKFM